MVGTFNWKTPMLYLFRISRPSNSQILRGQSEIYRKLHSTIVVFFLMHFWLIRFRNNNNKMQHWNRKCCFVWPTPFIIPASTSPSERTKKIATARKIKINDFRTHSENPFASIKSRKKEFFWKICTVTHHNHNHKVKFFVAFFSVFGSIETICTVNALYRVNCKKILILTFFHISFWFYCWFCICLFGHKV